MYNGLAKICQMFLDIAKKKKKNLDIQTFELLKCQKYQRIRKITAKKLLKKIYTHLCVCDYIIEKHKRNKCYLIKKKN